LIINLEGLENIYFFILISGLGEVDLVPFCPPPGAIGWMALIMVVASLRAILELMLRLCARGGLFCAKGSCQLSVLRDQGAGNGSARG
jgi:hypothetical protein